MAQRGSEVPRSEARGEPVAIPDIQLDRSGGERITDDPDAGPGAAPPIAVMPLTGASLGRSEVTRSIE